MPSPITDALYYPDLVDIVHRERGGPLTNIFIIRALSHTTFLAYDHYLLRSFLLTNIRPFELFPVQYLSHTIFWHTTFILHDLCHLRTSAITSIIQYELYHIRSSAFDVFLRTFGTRTLSIQSFVWTPSAIGSDRTSSYYDPGESEFQPWGDGEMAKVEKTTHQYKP